MVVPRLYVVNLCSYAGALGPADLACVVIAAEDSFSSTLPIRRESLTPVA